MARRAGIDPPHSQVAEAIVGPETASPRQEAAADKTATATVLADRLAYLLDQLLGIRRRQSFARSVVELECSDLFNYVVFCDPFFPGEILVAEDFPVKAYEPTAIG